MRERDVPGNGEAIIRCSAQGQVPPDWLSEDHLQQTLLECLPGSYLQHTSSASCGSGFDVRLIRIMDRIFGSSDGRLNILMMMVPCFKLRYSLSCASLPRLQIHGNVKYGTRKCGILSSYWVAKWWPILCTLMVGATGAP